jgi:endo-1,4-beta-D-glucanase Y
MLASERTRRLALTPYPEPAPTRRPRRRASIAGAAVLLAVLAAMLLSLSNSGVSAADGPAKSAARAFLSTYVDSDGRVVRRDQGNDTVSEGQAYALLLAQATGDQAGFERIWDWTRTHLQEPDGLFAFRADPQGNVADPQPASDADVLIAWALVQKNGPRAAEYHRAGREIAAAVLARETVRRGGTLMLAAGPWATGQPITLDPSYWAPAAFEALANATGDSRWRDLDDATIELSNELTSGGRLLPPDWARVDSTVPAATPAPNRQVPDVQYGLDAQRLVVWLATGCDARGPRLAARLDSLLSDREDALALSPSGQVINPQSNAMPLVAAAAAAQAAGNTAGRDGLLARAAREDRAYPTYYGTAWLALGRTLLTTRLLGGCQETG